MTTAVADLADQRRTVSARTSSAFAWIWRSIVSRTLLARRLGLGLDDVERAAERVLHDRLASGLAGERPFERPLEPFEALVVEARVAEDLRGDRPLRVVAELLRIEPEPGEAELLEVLGLARIGLPRDVDEAARAVGRASDRATAGSRPSSFPAASVRSRASSTCRGFA